MPLIECTGAQGTRCLRRTPPPSEPLYFLISSVVHYLSKIHVLKQCYVQRPLLFLALFNFKRHVNPIDTTPFGQISFKSYVMSLRMPTEAPNDHLVLLLKL